MVDTLTPSERSLRMALIRGVDTRPELQVRRTLHRLGYRFRLHHRDLPGKPDIAFPSRRKVIFVHGCFWHHHESCKVGHLPHSRREYWAEKFARNRERDARNLSAINELGWEAKVIWECEAKDQAALEGSLSAFLGPAGARVKI